MLINFTNLKRKYNLNITGIIHIGAHYGEEVQEYIDNGIQNITVFEPLSKNFDILQERLSDVNANIEGYQVALGSKEKKAIMYLSDNESQSSSILKPKTHITEMPWIHFKGTEEVEVKTLDGYNIEGCNFINIDVQGYEYEVLNNGTNKLKNAKVVKFESSPFHLYINEK